MNLGRVGVVVAARMSSSRLPGKAMLPLQGIPMIAFLLRRLAALRKGKVVVATTRLASDDVLESVIRQTGFDLYRGDDADVVGRYCATAEAFGFDTMVRVTADCPFVDAAMIDHCLEQTEAMPDADLATTKGQFPVGLDAEIYRAEGMARLNADPGLTADDREHLTLHYYKHPDRFSVRRIERPAAWPNSDRTYTVDTRADYDLARRRAESFDQPAFPIPELLRAGA